MNDELKFIYATALTVGAGLLLIGMTFGVHFAAGNRAGVMASLAAAALAWVAGNGAAFRSAWLYSLGSLGSAAAVVVSLFLI